MIDGQPNIPPTTPLTLVFSGVQGSGKGTQVELLTRFLETNFPERPVVVVGMGDILRTYTRENDNAFAKGVAEIMSRGGLLPGFAQSYILNHFLIKHVTAETHLIFEAAARSIPQAMLFEEIMAFYGRSEYQIISLELSVESARERLAKRGRYDEATAEQLDRRLAWHQNETVPALQWLAGKGHPVYSIDGEPAVEEIHAAILKTLGFR